MAKSKPNKTQNHGNNYRGKQGRKDSSAKRINEDNARISKVEKDIEEGKVQPYGNDIGWYMKNPELAKSAASLPVASIVGISSLPGTHKQVPGIMVLPWSPCLGKDEQIIAQSFNSMYSFIVHANSRNYKYDAPDLGVVTIAGAQVFSILSSMIRAYGLVKWYEEENAYIPDTLLMSLGFNPEDMRDDLAQIWFDINNLINQTKQIWIPDEFPFIDRWFWLNSQVFMDAQGKRAQLYAFVQDQYYGFSETGSTNGSALMVMLNDGTLAKEGEYPVTGTGAKVFNPALNQYFWQTWKTVAQSMINLLIQSQDRGIMYGDILKAYGAEHLKALPAITADYTVAPVYNAEVQMQIENYLPSPCIMTGFSQDTNHNYLVPKWLKNGIMPTTGQEYGKQWPIGGSVFGSIGQCVLNYHMDNVTPENIIISTRMTALGVQYSSAGTRPRAVGTEIPHPPLYWRFMSTFVAGRVSSPIAYPQFYPELNEEATSSDVASQALAVMAFDWHPFIYYAAMFSIPSNATTDWNYQNVNVYDIFGDFDNYTTVDPTTLQKLHQVCVYSELGVPHL